MKMLFVSVVALFSFAAQAMPTVGDYAEYSLNAVNNGQVFTGTATQAIVSQVGDQMTVATTSNIAGQSQAEQHAQKVSDLPSTEQVNQVLAYCSSAGGVSETVTVTAGTFPTCKLPSKDENDQQNGYVWIGQVPFGVVKTTQTDANGTTMNAELTKFIVGK